MMRIRTGASLAAFGAIEILLCGAQAADLTWQIPPVKTSLNVDGQPMEIQAWGTISAAQSVSAAFTKIGKELAVLKN